MKNSEIHKGLEKSEIRDFLSLSLVKLFEEECAKKEVIPYDGKDSIDWAIKDIDATIKDLEKRKEVMIARKSVIKLIKMNGWDEFDISDETINDTKYKLHRSFIGTQSEYDELIKTIVDDKEK